MPPPGPARAATWRRASPPRRPWSRRSACSGGFGLREVEIVAGEPPRCGSRAGRRGGGGERISLADPLPRLRGGGRAQVGSMGPSAAAALRRRGDARGRPLGDRGAGDARGGADGGRRHGARRGGRGARAAGAGAILCGKGNNGGDGLVAARRLGEMGFEVEALEIFGDELPADLDAWLAGSGAVVDAIFGTGFEALRVSRRPPRSRRPTAAARRSSPATSPPASMPRAARSRASRSRPRPRSPSMPRSRPPGRAGQGPHRRARRRADRDPRRRAGRAGGRGDRRRRCSAWRRAAAPPRPSSALAGRDRRRLAGADRRRADVLAGGDPGRRRLRDGRRPRRPRADLRVGSPR